VRGAAAPCEGFAVTKIECVDMGRYCYQVRIYDGNRFVMEYLPLAQSAISALMIALGELHTAGVTLKAESQPVTSAADLDMADRRGIAP
jgi:hypothetical protein